MVLSLKRCMCREVLMLDVRLLDVVRERMMLGKLYKCIQILCLLCLE